MRLAVVETTPYGGLLHYATQFADGLAGRGHDVDLIVPRENELAAGHDGPARMRPVLTPTVRWTEQPRHGRLRTLVRRAGVAARLTRSWARIVFEAARGRYDVVIINCDIGLTVSATGALALTHLPKGPAIAHVRHNVRLYNRWGGKELFASPPVQRFVHGRLTPRFDLVLLHGEHSRSEFTTDWPGVPTAVIPHGDERIFGDPPPPSEEERLLFFGDLRKVKGLPLLMEAFDVLAERRPSVRLTIAGRPSPQDFDPELLRAFARRHDGRVKLIDRYVPIEEVPSIFGEARAVVTPYYVGYQSGVVHLAMTMSRAVVATDVGDLPSAVIEGETGYVVPREDSAALADALERVVVDPELAIRLGAEGRRRALDRSGWEKVAELTESALLSLDGNAPR